MMGRGILSRWWPLLVVIAASGMAWAILFIAIPPPAQQFPLADDWVSTRSAVLFSRGEGIKYLHGRSVPQLGQWLWALPFIWASGGSPVALRLSTILMSWLGLWAFYDLLRQEGWPARQAALATALLAFHPVFFLIQGTFMTDVPALAMSLMSLALYGRALQTTRPGILTAATAVAVLATITRQNTLCVPLTAAFMLWRSPGLRRRLGWQLSVLAPLVIGLVTEYWFTSRPDVVPFHATAQPPRVVLLLVLLAVHWLGLACLPFILQDPCPTLPGSMLRSRVSSAGAALLFQGLLALEFGVALFGCLQFWPSGVLFFENIIHPFDAQRALAPYSIELIGPWGPFAGPFMVGQGPLYLGTPARIALTFLGYAAGAAFLWRLLVRWQTEGLSSPLLIFAGLQLVLLAVCQQMNDRYFLYLLPAALQVACSRKPARQLWWTPALAALLVMIVGTVALMHDWLSWNAARWRLGRRVLEERRIDPWDVEGGFEWDGWYAPETREETVADHPGISPTKEIRLPWIVNFRFLHVTGRYAISFAHPPDTKVLAREPFQLWLLPGTRYLYFIEYPPPLAAPAAAPEG